MEFGDHLLVYSSTPTSKTYQRALEVQITTEGEPIQATDHAQQIALATPHYARTRVGQQIIELENEVTATMENLFVESPAHRAQLFGALDRATKPADESRQSAPTVLPDVSSPPTAPEAVAPVREPASALSNAFALVAAVALAGVAAFFSIAGMTEVFPGAPVAVMAFAASMEAAKLIIAGWLAAHWPVAGWKLRIVLVALVTGLALIKTPRACSANWWRRTLHRLRRRVPASPRG